MTFKILILTSLIFGLPQIIWTQEKIDKIEPIDSIAQKTGPRENIDIDKFKKTNPEITGVYNYLDISYPKYITIGLNQDFVNSSFGLLLSNGYNERPLIHFEDFSEKMIYKINGQTDFNKDFSFDADLGWQYPLRQISLISIGYMQYNYSSRGLFYRDVNISVMTLSNFFNTSMIFSLGHQTLNDLKNIGSNIEIQKILKYRRLYSGLSCGYYFNYFTFSAYLQGYIYKDIINLRLEFERINKYNFLNLGLNFKFKR